MHSPYLALLKFGDRMVFRVLLMSPLFVSIPHRLLDRKGFVRERQHHSGWHSVPVQNRVGRMVLQDNLAYFGHSTFSPRGSAEVQVEFSRLSMLVAFE